MAASAYHIISIKGGKKPNLETQFTFVTSHIDKVVELYFCANII